MRIKKYRHMSLFFVVMGLAFFSLCSSVFGFGRAFQSLSRPPAEPSASVMVRHYSLKHVSAESIQPFISKLYTDATCVGESQWKKLVCRAEEPMLSQIQRTLDALDKPVPQFHIKVQVLETASVDAHVFKQLLSDLGDQLKATLDFGAMQFKSTALLENALLMLIQEGKATLKAKPTLTTIDNEEATIRVGDRIPYITTIVKQAQEVQEVRHLDTGVELRLLPTLLDQNRVRIKVFSRISEVKVWMNLGEASYPVLSNRQAEAEVELKLGETLVIAGLLDETEKQSVKRVPFLSKLPWVGKLFRSEAKEKAVSDVWFLITPTLYSAHSVTVGGVGEVSSLTK